jgi:DNA-binding response OmpR family regulator
VLLVEDDLPIATLMSDALTHNGYIVDAVSNGAEALDSLNAYRPDAIVLDLMLPEVHGWAFIERYTAFTNGQPLPIVVVSAAGAIPKSTYALGVRQFIPKPFDVDEVVRAVADIVDARQET